MSDTSKVKPTVNKKMRQSNSFEYYLVKKVGKTIKRYGMIKEGDRIIAAVSGGKDSLTMLKILNDRMGFYPNNFELIAVHIVSDLPCEGLADPSTLEEYFKKNNYRYLFVNMKVRGVERGLSSFWCSWNRRRVLFDTATKLGYNKIAFGHQRNDVLETLLLNIFYHAEISTMLPVQSLFEGRITIIRPLYHIPESDTIKLAKIYGFPSAHCRCPVEHETKRELLRRLISEIERVNPRAGVNALRSLENIKKDYLPSSVVVEDLVI
ncbi:MAG: tRNA 2-thiocytidine biosynthesis TtcA family protein [Spirochaetota bacterium]